MIGSTTGTSLPLLDRRTANIKPWTTLAFAAHLVVAVVRSVVLLALTEQVVVRASVGAVTGELAVAVALVWALVCAVTAFPRWLVSRRLPAGDGMAVTYDVTSFGVWALAAGAGMTIPDVGAVLLGYATLVVTGYRFVTIERPAPKVASVLLGATAVGVLLAAHSPIGTIPEVGAVLAWACILAGARGGALISLIRINMNSCARRLDGRVRHERKAR